MAKKQFYIYIMTNKKRGTLYVGVTSDLIKRVYEHRNGLIDGFTKKYNLDKLVYFEVCDHWEGAINREKRLKRWNRDWKIEAVEKENPNWEDLYDEICGVRQIRRVLQEIPAQGGDDEVMIA